MSDPPTLLLHDKMGDQSAPNADVPIPTHPFDPSSGLPLMSGLLRSMLKTEAPLTHPCATPCVTLSFIAYQDSVALPKAPRWISLQRPPAPATDPAKSPPHRRQWRRSPRCPPAPALATQDPPAARFQLRAGLLLLLQIDGVASGEMAGCRSRTNSRLPNGSIRVDRSCF